MYLTTKIAAILYWWADTVGLLYLLNNNFRVETFYEKELKYSTTYSKSQFHRADRHGGHVSLLTAVVVHRSKVPDPLALAGRYHMTLFGSALKNFKLQSFVDHRCFIPHDDDNAPPVWSWNSYVHIWDWPWIFTQQPHDIDNESDSCAYSDTVTIPLQRHSATSSKWFLFTNYQVMPIVTQAGQLYVHIFRLIFGRWCPNKKGLHLTAAWFNFGHIPMTTATATMFPWSRCCNNDDEHITAAPMRDGGRTMPQSMWHFFLIIYDPNDITIRCGMRRTRAYNLATMFGGLQVASTVRWSLTGL